ncbi:hypothetical protein [Paenibacillus sp. MMS20-IR301]|uniref:hypothetical protein n=1 Tax=Paenibacillus sp. MMS20-IR301 TaxID=2895946 RepID=UPI0028EBBD94|nr:hypothetical protein [Paenibacillus sp. MMS20-IR301]WNS45702.1 hypothetical protein LOS79_10660 [Paenibacillus sp. MMS20-IR301]
MNSNIRRITVFAAAVMLSLAPAAAFAEHPSAGKPTAAPDSIHAGQGHGHPHSREKGFRTGGHFIISESAKLLEMDRSELINSLKAGKTLYGLAQEKKGWSEEQYIQKLTEAAGLKLDESVKDGRLTKEDADKLRAGLPVMIKLSLSHTARIQQGQPSQQPSQQPSAPKNR